MFQKLKIAKTDEGQQNGSKEEGHVTDDPDTWHEQCEDAVMHWTCIRCGGRSVTREKHQLSLELVRHSARTLTY